MDQDDPEQRIAELDRQHAKGQDKRPLVRRKQPPALWKRLVIAILAMTPVWGFGAYLAVIYLLSTPATVTDVICHGGGRGRRCIGTWSIDGQSYSGHIVGPIPGHGGPGFRVHGDTAYTGVTGLIGLLMAALPIVVLVTSLIRMRMKAR